MAKKKKAAKKKKKYVCCSRAVGGGGLPPGLFLSYCVRVRRGVATPPALFFYELDDLDDLAGLQAARADAHPLRPSLDHGAQRDQIRKPPPLGHIVGVADLVTDGRTLPTDITASSHADPLPIPDLSVVCWMRRPFIACPGAESKLTREHLTAEGPGEQG